MAAALLVAAIFAPAACAKPHPPTAPKTAKAAKSAAIRTHPVALTATHRTPDNITVRDAADPTTQLAAPASATPKDSKFTEPTIALTKNDTVLMCGPKRPFIAYLRWADWNGFPRQNVGTAGGSDCDIKIGPGNTTYLANLQI